MKPPTHDVLHALASGRLPPDEAEQVAAWLDRNPQTVNLDDLGRSDPFVNMLSRVPAGWRPDPAADRLARRLAENLPALTDNWRDPELPAFVGKWRVVRKLGEGGMGVVYLAEDAARKRKAAIKVLKDRTRFLREALAAARIENDNVVGVLDILDNPPAIVMEYVPGESLENWAKARARKVTAADMVWAARELLTGLKAAHAKGIVHRDVKPQNAIVADGRIKLLDFGLARTPAADDGLTVTGTVLGTPAYMSPEQAKGQPPDPQADVYSVGVVLYRLVTGASPFQRASVLETLAAVALHNPPPLELPAELSQFVARLMSRDLTERPKDAAEALALLPQLDRPKDAEVLELLPRLDRPRRRVRWAVAAGLVLAAAAVVAGIVITARDKDGKVLWTLEVADRGTPVGKLDVTDTSTGKKTTILVGKNEKVVVPPPPPPPPPPKRRVTVNQNAFVYADATGDKPPQKLDRVYKGTKAILLDGDPSKDRWQIQLESGEQVWIADVCVTED